MSTPLRRRPRPLNLRFGSPACPSSAGHSPVRPITVARSLLLSLHAHFTNSSFADSLCPALGRREEADRRVIDGKLSLALGLARRGCRKERQPLGCLIPPTTTLCPPDDTRSLCLACSSTRPVALARTRSSPKFLQRSDGTALTAGRPLDARRQEARRAGARQLPLRRPGRSQARRRPLGPVRDARSASREALS
jgi:hypothetical protein